MTDKILSPIESLRSHLRHRQTLRGHVWQSLANYAQQGFGLVFGVVLARILAPADFGVYGLAGAIVIVALLPATWSLSQTLVADAGRTPSLHGVAAGFAWCIVGIRCAISLLLSGWFLVVGRPQMAGLCLMIGCTESFRELILVQRAALEGAGQFKANFVSAVVNIALSLAVVVPVALRGFGPYTLALPGLIGLVADYVIYRRFTRCSVFVRPQWAISGTHFRAGLWMWFNTVSEVGLARIDKWFIGTFRGEAPLGHYSRAFGYAPLSFMALNSLLANPAIVGLVRCETVAKRRRLFGKTAAILLIGGTLNWLVLFFYSPVIVRVVFGPQWDESIPLFQAFASLSLAYAFCYLPITVMFAAGRFAESGIVRLSSLLVLIGIVFFFRETCTPLFVAWLIQALLVVQGMILFFRCLPFFRHEYSPPS